MTIKEVSDKLGITPRAIYKQIKEKRALGKYFEKNKMDKWVIDEKHLDGLIQ